MFDCGDLMNLGNWGDLCVSATTPSAELYQLLLSGTDLHNVVFHLKDIDYVDPVSGTTPLTVACVCGYWSIVVLLLKRGADATSSIPAPANTEAAYGSETVHVYCTRKMEEVRSMDPSLADALTAALA
jgi:hypothetical protein